MKLDDGEYWAAAAGLDDEATYLNEWIEAGGVSGVAAGRAVADGEDEIMRAEGEGWTLIQGDCPAALAELADNSVDSVVTDPPAGINFMGQNFDRDYGGRDNWVKVHAAIFAECLRVIRPGGHALVWALPRTSHWTMCALEDAGWDIRDVVTHLFGSGFPKSKNVGAVLGLEPTARGTALKPAAEYWILARKPLAASTVAANVLEHGVGAINISACRVETVDNLGRSNHVGPYSSERTWSTSATKGIDNTNNPPAGRWPSNLVLSHSEGCVKVGRKRVQGNGDPDRFRGYNKFKGTHYADDEYSLNMPNGKAGEYADADGMEEVDEWRCAPGCAVAALDSQAGERKPGKAVRTRSGGNTFGGNKPKPPLPDMEYNDGSHVSRFFPVFAYEEDDFVPFRYVSKASRREREAGLEGMPPSFMVAMNDGIGARPHNPEQPTAWVKNAHPTVKPLTLMSWLCRLVTPPGGVVLDPFTGSGSTGCAALREGFRFIGVEREAEYIEIARRRLEYTLSQRPAVTQARLSV